LVLRRDYAFQQEVDSGATIQRAVGSWSVVGEGHIALSKEFITLPGESSSPSGTVYGQIANRFGSVSIALYPNPGGPVFRRKWFR
jgi:hypothetical protein